jgi:hypothetical protein
MRAVGLVFEIACDDFAAFVEDGLEGAGACFVVDGIEPPARDRRLERVVVGGVAVEDLFERIGGIAGAVDGEEAVADGVPGEGGLGRQAVGGEDLRAVFELPLLGRRGVFGAAADRRPCRCSCRSRGAPRQGGLLRRADQTAFGVEDVDETAVVTRSAPS